MKYKVIQDGDFYRIQTQYKTSMIFTSGEMTLEQVNAELEKLRARGFTTA